MNGYRYLALALGNIYYTLTIGLICTTIFILFLSFTKTRSIGNPKAIVLLLLLIALATVLALSIDLIVWNTNLMVGGIYLVAGPIYPALFFTSRNLFHKEREANLGKYISISVSTLILAIVTVFLADTYWI